MTKMRLPRRLQGLKSRMRKWKTSPSSVSTLAVEEISSAASGIGKVAPDAATDNEVPLWNVAAASIAGVSHEMRGLDSDDWYEVEARRKELFVVVADGMGSARFGAVGARLACRAAMTALLQHCFYGETDKQMMNAVRVAVGKAQGAIEGAARALSCTGRDLATTLVCVVATDRHVLLGQVGDCACVVLTDQDEALTITLPQKGEYANQTYCLGVNEEVLLSKIYRGRVKGLALFTDGLERIALNKNAPYLPFLVPLWQFAASQRLAHDGLEELLKSDRLRRATDDDCTLVIAAKTASEIEQ